MTLRRLLVGCGAVAVVAAAGFVPAAAAGSAAARTICVGLIVDPRAVGGSVSDGCVNVAPGSSGTDVLDAGGHSFTFRKDGLLCTIDDLPTSGCDHVDNTHYWAYYHRAPDRTVWSYSNQGAATYEPANRSTEGWAYDDGAEMTPKPDNIPAGQICTALLKPSPTPTAASSKPRATQTASESPSPIASPRPSATKTHRVKPTPTQGATTASIPTPSPTAVASTGTGSHGSATGALIAAGVIAILAAAGVIGARRRRS